MRGDNMRVRISGTETRWRPPWRPLATWGEDFTVRSSPGFSPPRLSVLWVWENRAGPVGSRPLSLRLLSVLQSWLCLPAVWLGGVVWKACAIQAWSSPRSRSQSLRVSFRNEANLYLCLIPLLDPSFWVLFVEPSHTQLCFIFYNTIFIIVEDPKQPKCQITDCLSKSWHIHTIQSNAIIKKYTIYEYLIMQKVV